MRQQKMSFEIFINSLTGPDVAFPGLGFDGLLTSPAQQRQLQRRRVCQVAGQLTLKSTMQSH